MRQRWISQARLPVFWVACCCLLGLVLSATPGVVLAQDMARAQAAYSEGYDLYQKRKYRKALQYFEKALTLAPTTRRYVRFRSFLRFLIGMCQYYLRLWRPAQRQLKAYLKAGQGRQKHRLQATAALRDSQRRLRRLAALRRARLRSRPGPAAPRPTIRPTQPPVSPRTTVLQREVAPPARIMPAGPAPRTPVRPSVPPETPPVTRVAAPIKRDPQPLAKSPAPRGTRNALLVGSSSPSRPRLVPPTSSYVLAAVGGSVLVVGGVLLGVAFATQAPALALHQEFNASSGPKPDAEKVREPLASARTMTYIAYPMLGTGVALAATGLILFFVARQPAPAAPPEATKAPTQLFLHRLFP